MEPQIWDEARTVSLGTGSVGLVLSHGFTGTTSSVAPWARGIADSLGVRVLAPRLPGHGTSPQDMARSSWRQWFSAVEEAYETLQETCTSVFVGGLSMGGALALRLAQTRDVSGVLLVNPAVASRNPLIPLAGGLRHVVRWQPAIASDIKAPGVEELAYDKVSVAAVAQMSRLWRAVVQDLGRVSAPVLLFRSTEDHVVDDSSHVLLQRRLPALQLVPLTNSYHVATLDNDADLVVQESVAFIRRHARDSRVL